MCSFRLLILVSAISYSEAVAQAIPSAKEIAKAMSQFEHSLDGLRVEFAGTGNLPDRKIEDPVDRGWIDTSPDGLYRRAVCFFPGFAWPNGLEGPKVEREFVQERYLSYRRDWSCRSQVSRQESGGRPRSLNVTYCNEKSLKESGLPREDGFIGSELLAMIDRSWLSEHLEGRSLEVRAAETEGAEIEVVVTGKAGSRLTLRLNAELWPVVCEFQKQVGGVREVLGPYTYQTVDVRVVPWSVR